MKRKINKIKNKIYEIKRGEKKLIELEKDTCFIEYPNEKPVRNYEDTDFIYNYIIKFSWGVWVAGGIGVKNDRGINHLHYFKDAKENFHEFCFVNFNFDKMLVRYNRITKH